MSGFRVALADRLVTRVLVWYPGLLCKLLSALLLVPAIERGLAALVLRKIQAHFLGGLNLNQTVGGPLPPGSLKPARGRVVK